MTIMCFDIETTAIPPEGSSYIDTIHAIGIKVNNNQVLKFTKYYLEGSDGSLQMAVKLLNTADLIVSFNGQNFDIPIIERLLKTKLTAKHLDLLLVAKLLFSVDNLFAADPKLMPNNTELWGKFSLKAFGRRINKSQKTEFEDWSRLSSEMLDYMVADVEVTKDIYDFFIAIDTYPNDKVLQLEHDVAAIIQEQEKYGFYFDINKARNLNMRLNREQLKIEHKIAKVFRPKLLPDGPEQKTNNLIKRKMYVKDINYKPKTIGLYRPYQYKFLKNGKTKLPSKSKYKYFDTPHKLIIVEKNGSFQNIKLVKFTATDMQIKIWLKRMFDFEFSTYTQKGNVRVDRDDLDKFGKELSDRVVKNKAALLQHKG